MLLESLWRLPGTAADELANLQPQGGEDRQRRRCAPRNTLGQHQGTAQSSSKLFPLAPEPFHTGRCHRLASGKTGRRALADRFQAQVREVWFVGKAEGDQPGVQPEALDGHATEKCGGDSGRKRRQSPATPGLWPPQQQFRIGQCRQAPG